jgi:diguanylate cyclase (GGDEF)-like protein
MNPLHWRPCQLLGPLLTFALAGVLLLLMRAGIAVPMPGAMMAGMVLLSSCIGGTIAGYVSAVVGAYTSVVLLSEPGLSFVPALPWRLHLVVPLALILPLLIGHLRKRAARNLERERHLRERAETANRELRALRTELMRRTQELERLATTDDLTGLCNRRHFLALAQGECRRHAHERKPLALLIFDIDLFKSVNDRFGHDAGDAVIRHVVRTCRNEMSATDILARVGGEEFVLLLPETTGEQAATLAERMRKRLEEAPLALDGTDVKVTISIGVCEAAAGSQSIGGLMKRADQALYRAKRDGRNLVRYGGPAAPPSADAPVARAAVAA